MITLKKYSAKNPSGNRGLKLGLGAITALLSLATLQCSAQLNPFQNMYYINRYQLNPAFAGLENGLNLNIGYRQQWSSFPGTPKTGAFTADYQAGNRVGIGLNVSDDQSGLIRTTRAVASYAYHLPLSEQGEHLSFGLSLGVNDGRVDYNKVNGDVSDAEIVQYNNLKPYIDGDVGVAYTGSNLMVSTAMPNLKSTLFNASDRRFDADMLLFVAAASYKINMKNEYSDLTLEPLAAYRIVKGNTDIFDAGLKFDMNNYGLYLQTIYHSNQDISLGMGLNQQTYVFSFAYNLETGQLSSYTHGAFELGLKLNLFNKTK